MGGNSNIHTMKQKETGTNNATETKSENLTFPVSVKVGKDNFQNYFFNPNVLLDLPALIGKLISMFPQAFSFHTDFPVNKSLLNVPAASGGKGEKERVGRAFKDLTKLMFAGSERDEVTTDKKKIAVLETFRKKGFKFSSYSFASVSEAINIKMQRQTAAILLQRELTQGIKENKVTIQQTKTIQAVRKIAKDGGRDAVVKYLNENKTVSTLLPAIVEL